MQKIARGRPKPSQSKVKYRAPSYWTIYDRNEVKDERAAQIITPIRDYVIRYRRASASNIKDEMKAAKPVQDKSRER